jgi:hypothetical protein
MRVMFSKELASLFHRDLTRLSQELQAFPDDVLLWMTTPGISNSAGNLTLHLEGNLREYIGRQLGGVAYTRQREEEFTANGLSRLELVARIHDVRTIIPRVLEGLSEQSLQSTYPEKVLDTDMTTQQYLLHLYGHFSYHLGQIDYARRIFAKNGAVKFATL